MPVPSVPLNNGLTMPGFGLGTYKSDDDEAIEVIKHAIDQGYRHIDTAYGYQNEVYVGQAIREKIADGTVTRADIFLVTKFSDAFHEPDKVEYACRLSLKNLGLDYIDLYLMHTPMAVPYVGAGERSPKDSEGNLLFSDLDYVDTWRAMENLVELGLVKSLGVSNFNSEQLDRVLKEGSIKPVTNQVECGPTLNQKELIKFCRDRDVTVTAYTPLGRMRAPNPDGPKAAVEDEKVVAIGVKYGKTPAQVVLRYITQLGAIPIPKSSNKARVEQNINIFDFELTEDEMKVMRSFDTGERMVPFLSLAKHKHYPFNIKF